MANHLMIFGLAAAFVTAGCASTVQAEPEPTTPPLRIEDRSADAPPPPPPSAPPSDAIAVSTLAPPSAPQSPPMPPQNASSAPAPHGAPPAAPVAAMGSAPTEPAPAASTPPSTTWTQEYPSGRWVSANGYGWMWVPANAPIAENDGVPYTYMYTPTYGWTWYISPWGPGPYHYGVWVRRPWHPVGWRGAWVARPAVVIRLGGPGPRYHYRSRPRHWR